MAPITAEGIGVHTANRLTPKPSHNGGKVMLSGRSWVSISIPVSAVSTQIKTNALMASGPNPNCQAAKPDSNPVINSTNGYRTEMLMPHWAHWPRNISQLMTGMFCQGLIGAPQSGHWEPGRDSVRGGSSGTGCSSSSQHSRRQLSSIILGNRRITTLRKLPTISPNAVQVSVKKTGS